MRYRTPAIPLAMCLAVSPVAAVNGVSASRTPESGQRVKVRWQPAPSTAVATLTGEWLAGDTREARVRRLDGRVEIIKADAIRSLHVSAGRKRATGRGAGIGFVVGGLGMGVLWAAASSRCGDCEGPGSGGVLASIGVVAVGGAAAGAIIGSTVKVDDWRKATLSSPAEVVGVRTGPFHWAVTSGPAGGTHSAGTAIGGRLTIGF